MRVCPQHNGPDPQDSSIYLTFGIFSSHSQRYTACDLMEYASSRVPNHKDLNLLREQECRAPVVELHEVHDPFEIANLPQNQWGLPKAQPARVIPDWSKQATVSPNYAHQNLWSFSRRAGSAALRGLPGGLSRIRFGK